MWQLGKGGASSRLRRTWSKAPRIQGITLYFQACYSRSLKYSWLGNSNFRDWLPVIIVLFSEWSADVTATFRRLDHCNALYSRNL
jgi:hypothetical protein